MTTIELNDEQLSMLYQAIRIAQQAVLNDLDRVRRETNLTAKTRDALMADLNRQSNQIAALYALAYKEAQDN